MIALSEAGRDDVGPSPACGGNTILDLALCLILSVTVVGLLLVAL
jgi:hypothetical protein